MYEFKTLFVRSYLNAESDSGNVRMYMGKNVINLNCNAYL